MHFFPAMHVYTCAISATPQRQQPPDDDDDNDDDATPLAWCGVYSLLDNC